MIIFHSDLDNTLIYSYKHDIGQEKKCVEIYEGREVSFMSLRSQELLKEANKKFLFVPTTTRDIGQYRRIDLGLGQPEYALACNGGILLKNGEIDQGWYQESLQLIEGCRDELQKAAILLSQDADRCLDVRDINQLFLFTKSNEPMKSAERLKQSLNLEKVDIFCNGIKVYVLPKQLTKGNAVRRLKGRLGAEFTLAAGDSEFDVSMLNEADAAMAPEGLAGHWALRRNLAVFQGKQLFSDALLQYALEHY